MNTQKQAQIASLKTVFPTLVEKVPQSVYSFFYLLSNNPRQFFINFVVTLPTDFPKTAPIFTIFPIIKHSYVDSNTGIVSPRISKLFYNWSLQTNLAQTAIEVLNGLRSPFLRPGVTPVVCSQNGTTAGTVVNAPQNQFSVPMPTLVPANMQMQPAQPQQPQQQSLPQPQKQKEQAPAPLPKSRIEPLLKELEAFETINIADEFDLEQNENELKELLESKNSSIVSNIKKTSQYKKMKEIDERAKAILDELINENDALLDDVRAKKEEVAKKQAQKEELLKKVNELQAKKDAACSKYSKENLIIMLTEKADEADEASNAIEKDFKKGKIELEEFIEKYKEARYEYHSICIRKQLLKTGNM